MQSPSEYIARLALKLRRDRRSRRRRGESQSDFNIRRFRQLEASYLRIGLRPRQATAAAMNK